MDAANAAVAAQKDDKSLMTAVQRWVQVHTKMGSSSRSGSAFANYQRGCINRANCLVVFSVLDPLHQ